MNKEDIIMNTIFFSAITLSVLLSIHMVNNDIEVDTMPLHWPETFEPYEEPIKEEYHGKEGKSEYGEYEPNKCLQLKDDSYNKWMNMQ